MVDQSTIINVSKTWKWRRSTIWHKGESWNLSYAIYHLSTPRLKKRSTSDRSPSICYCTENIHGCWSEIRHLVMYFWISSLFSKASMSILVNPAFSARPRQSRHVPSALGSSFLLSNCGGDGIRFSNYCPVELCFEKIHNVLGSESFSARGCVKLAPAREAGGSKIRDSCNGCNQNATWNLYLNQNFQVKFSVPSLSLIASILLESVLCCPNKQSKVAWTKTTLSQTLTTFICAAE